MEPSVFLSLALLLLNQTCTLASESVVLNSQGEGGLEEVILIFLLLLLPPLLLFLPLFLLLLLLLFMLLLTSVLVPL